jgi:hypothetical protein
VIIRSITAFLAVCAVVLASATTAAAVDQTEGTTATVSPVPKPEPRSLANVTQALDNGVDRICPWFFSPASKGDEAEPFIGKLRKVAAENGYAGGTSLSIIFPMDKGQMSSSSVGMQSNIQPPPNGGVALFVQFHYPVCQLQVWGFAEEASKFVVDLPESGWASVGKPKRKGNIETRRFRGSSGATMVTNRWVGTKPSELKLVINYFAGEEKTRGELTDGR